MNEKQQKNKEIKLDEFENISLWQLLPAGNKNGLKKLKEIVNSIHNGQALRQNNRPLSLLIAGETGKRTHSYAFLRSIAIEYIQHSPASMLISPMEFVELFYGSIPDNAYVITDINYLPHGNRTKLYQILNEGMFSYMGMDGRKKSVPVLSSIVATVKDINMVPDIIKDSFQYSVELGEYTPQQKELIAYQRLKYAGIEIENEEVLMRLMALSPSDLNDLIKLLNLSVMVMMADGRNVLTSEDIRKGKELW